MEGTGNRAICSICYEELKPIVEDIQAVSVCGHVFHEICLQQWFEYCPSNRKQTCPVCKQSCSSNKVCRLYFQSTGELTDASVTQGLTDRAKDPETLRREVLRLEAKMSGLNSTLERQTKDLNELNDELCQYKELVKREVSLKDDAIKQKSAIQQLLHLKSQELDKSSLECLKLHDRNMALAKELAALKLVSDLELGEDEVLKLASLGNESNTRETIDILRKSLVIRNKSYKELMAKCNVLGRGEARYGIKLEKAREKITKLKIRVQELETATETKDNGILRALKASKEKSSKRPVVYDIKSPNAKKFRVEEQPIQHPATLSNSEVVIVTDTSNHKQKIEDYKSKKDSAACRPLASGVTNTWETPFILIDKDASELPTADQSLLNSNICHLSSETFAVKDSSSLDSGLKYSSNVNRKVSNSDLSTAQPAISGSRARSDLSGCNNSATDDDTMLLDDAPAPTTLTIRKEAPGVLPVMKPGDVCFSSGLLGPDGTSRYLGKWCKRVETKALKTVQNASKGNLIAVGSDGRGGRVKVLRSPIHSLPGDKESLAKKSRNGSKTAISQSQGSLQIEHFFQKANPS